MRIVQIYTPGIAQCSYLVGSEDKCVIVDPIRSVDQYLEKAKEFEMEIVAILETHLHADFISGHMDLAEKTGAEIYAPKSGNCSFPHIALSDGEDFTFGSLNFKLLDTPGHTPDCAVYVVADLERGKEPVIIFTGDTLLVGDVGRPDLFPNREEELAEQLFHSLKKLKELPDHVEVYPAHGMGSLCGRSLSPKLWSTIGTERRHNYALQYDDLESFKKDLLTGMPAAPDHFVRCTEINRQGPTLVDSLPKPEPFDTHEIKREMEKGKIVLDTRSYLSFASAHIPGSYSISKYTNLPTFAGWIIPPEDEILLIMEDKNDFPKIRETLLNVGVDNIVGYLNGVIGEWINKGLPLDHVETISVEGLNNKLGDSSLLLLDNRAEGEWKKEHIEGSVLAPTPDVRHLYAKWDAEKPIYLICNSGSRSMVAASILKQKGFKRVINTAGGTTAWKAAGYPLKSEDGEEL